MKKTMLMRLFSLVLVLTLVAATAFVLASCGNKKTDTPDTQNSAEKITIAVSVKGSDGNVTDFTITTSEKYLRGALEAENLIEGDEGEFGLYVKVVNGERADYDTDGAYWSFSQNGEMLMTGVDTTPISDGDTFLIEYTKG